MRRRIYDIAMSLAWIVALLPCLLVLNSTIIGTALGIIYTVLLASFVRGTSAGRWLFREVWKATLRLEYDIFGANAESK